MELGEAVGASVVVLLVAVVEAGFVVVVLGLDEVVLEVTGSQLTVVVVAGFAEYDFKVVVEVVEVVVEVFVVVVVALVVVEAGKVAGFDEEVWRRVSA